ncbi:MAG: hypothetical protein KAU50_00040 [Candidatus Marinimicrobia bacterium]|nr:hypothetical protein [Candidatus Neomarinimicrobiota bacterium]
MKKQAVIFGVLAFVFMAGVAVGAVVEVKAYVFSGVADASLTAEIETGLGQLALDHANNPVRLDGKLSGAGGNCPISLIQVNCSDSTGTRVWSWEYRTELVTWNKTPQ